MYAGGVSEPVVRVNDVAVNGAGDDAGSDGVVVDFLEEVIGVTTGELDAPEVVGAHIVEVGVDVVAEAVVQLGRHELADARIYIVAIDVAPGNWHLRRADDVSEATVFVAPGLRNDKSDVDIATLPHAARQAIRGGAETAKDMRGKFPPEH